MDVAQVLWALVARAGKRSARQLQPRQRAFFFVVVAFARPLCGTVGQATAQASWARRRWRRTQHRCTSQQHAFSALSFTLDLPLTHQPAANASHLFAARTGPLGSMEGGDLGANYAGVFDGHLKPGKKPCLLIIDFVQVCEEQDALRRRRTRSRTAGGGWPRGRQASDTTLGIRRISPDPDYPAGLPAHGLAHLRGRGERAGSHEAVARAGPAQRHPRHPHQRGVPARGRQWR